MNATTETRDMLQMMLTENTGRNFLDSGCAYGRHWERNQGKAFDSEPEGSVEFWCYPHSNHLKEGETQTADICATISVYHFLLNRLEYNLELDEQYREWCENEGEDFYHYQSGIDFASAIGGKGIYGDGDPFCENTYNHEDLLSQTIQYVYWTDDDGAHILLQIHGGCDVRGGYTDPVAFDVDDYDGTSIFDNARATIYCADCDSHWDTDDGCHWYPDGCCGRGYTQLDEYPAIEDDELWDYHDWSTSCLADRMGFKHGLIQPAPYHPDTIRIDSDKNGYCPKCGGSLKCYPWPTG